jgi:hypothetical protein
MPRTLCLLQAVSCQLYFSMLYPQTKKAGIIPPKMVFSKKSLVEA